MNTRILGRTWEEIQAMQNKTYTPELIPSTPNTSDLDRHATADAELLEQYGSIEALEVAGMFGVTDRINRRRNLLKGNPT